MDFSNMFKVIVTGDYKISFSGHLHRHRNYNIKNEITRGVLFRAGYDEIPEVRDFVEECGGKIAVISRRHYYRFVDEKTGRLHRHYSDGFIALDSNCFIAYSNDEKAQKDIEAAFGVLEKRSTKKTTTKKAVSVKIKKSGMASIRSKVTNLCQMLGLTNKKDVVVTIKNIPITLSMIRSVKHKLPEDTMKLIAKRLGDRIHRKKK